MNAPLTPALLAAAPDERDAAPHRKELGLFLRARRESLDPQRLGLPRAGRRRTPGLRREEVALLADVGVTWYTWLEQGRDIQASPRALGAIAQALQCNPTETHHLFRLAGLTAPASATLAPLCERPSAAVAALLRQLDPYPALMQNARMDIADFNPAFCRLVNIDLNQVDPGDRNCAYLTLTHPQWRASVADWPGMVRHIVAHFRAAMAERMDDPAWQHMLERLLAVSEEFRELWPRYEVAGVANHVKVFQRPREGQLRLHQINWWSAPRNGDRLIVYMPADEAAEAALRRMAAQDGLVAV
ncbi:MAG: hypothetical protein GAK30_00761 [Paracidovorax wautersii]|uniref:HTH cro/C1-type domain-containing protein n=1 Tax=Paracidovorax wautersii TaxID=1177982 RepID=A0A7V8FR76_9BURK|nr:MAG: hypothetical protein GAK30_00761 [Paracidovorax wautersii]